MGLFNDRFSGYHLLATIFTSSANMVQLLHFKYIVYIVETH
jgi:hypothetical protein